MKKQWKRWLALGLTLTAMGSMALSAKDVEPTAYIVHADAYQLPYKGNEKAFNHHINPGYGSALALKSVKADGTMEFYAITDRGPNGDIPMYVKDGKRCPGNSSRRRTSRPASASSRSIRLKTGPISFLPSP